MVIKVKKRKKKKNLLKNKYTYIILFIFLVFLSFLEIKGKIYIEGVFRDLIFLPTSIVSSPQFIDNLNEEIKSENVELKKLMDVYSLSDFDAIYATVIERNTFYWNNSVTINKGSNDSIEEGLAVVDTNGLLGVIDKVSYNSSTVKLITSNDKYNNIAVKILGEVEVNKILFAKNDKLIIDGVNKNLKFKENDKVITSGLNGKIPSGIMVGLVSSVTSDNYDLSNILCVDPVADISNIRFVAILKRKI